MQLRALLPFLIAAAALVSTPARADLRLDLRMGSIWVLDPAFDLVAEQDAMANILFVAGWDGGPFALELAYGISGAGATTFETIDASFFLQQIQGAASFRVPMGTHWRAFARGAAGLDHGRITLSGSRDVEATAWGVGVEGTLGTELRLPISQSSDRWSKSLGFTAEAGYGWRPVVLDFDEGTAKGDDDASPPPLARGPVDLGTLDLSGPILRFGISLLF